MTVTGVVINSRDVRRSVDFYTGLLDAQVREADERHAVLDVASGVLDIVAVGAGAPASSWVPDDLQRGFRHIGFKVASVDAVADRVRAAGLAFHLEPVEATGDVRIAFFRDPDGTLVEVVERHLQYDPVIDAAAVAREHALPTPARPRLDHVAVTAPDFAATAARWTPLGYVHSGRLLFPDDPRGFDIDYLYDGGVVVEVFTFDDETRPRAAQVGAPGFGAALVAGPLPAGTRAVGTGPDGREIVVDPDGLTLTAADS